MLLSRATKLVLCASFAAVSGCGDNLRGDPKLVSIAITPPNPSIAAGRSIQLVATATYGSDGDAVMTADVTSRVTWHSDASVASVSTTGLAGGIARGTSTITASLDDNGTTVMGATTLTVTDAVLVSIAVTPPDPAVAKGFSKPFIATGMFSDGTTQDVTTQATWVSSDATVATVSNVTATAGVATSLGTGVSTISARIAEITGGTTLTVTDAVLVSIAITPLDSTIAKGTSQQLAATGTFSDSTTQDLTKQVTWTSSDTTVAAISSASATPGVASTSLATVPGTTTITATIGAISGSTTLTVTGAVLVSIDVAPATPAIPKGAAQQFTATGVYSDGTTIAMTPSVTWTTSDATRLSISNAAGEQGLAGALDSAGTITVTATDPVTRLSGTATVTLTAATLIQIEVDPPSETLPRGSTEFYTATGIYSDFTTVDLTATVTWSSSNTTVATISNAAGNEGTATTIAPGTTTIGAFDVASGISGTTTLVVGNTVLASIVVAPASPTIAKGARLQLTAIGHYTDGSTRNITQFVSWSSSANSVAGVSNAPKKRGVATGKSAGAANITAADPATGIAGSTTLFVTTASLSSITISPVDPTIASGTHQYFTATGHFSDGSTSDLTAIVNWTSSNTGVATISNQTFSNGVATGVAPGTTTITATDPATLINASTSLTVSTATLRSIAITPANPTIIKGLTQPMTATGTFSDNSTQDLTLQVTWLSADTAIATVTNTGSTKGTVLGVAVGATAISATYPRTVISGRTTVTVIP